MGLNYVNLDVATREYIASELTQGHHYNSPRLNQRGLTAWVPLLTQALVSHSDVWLERELLRQGLFNEQEQYVRMGKTYYRKFNKEDAARMLAEGEFNRFYLRGLCLRAIAEGVSDLVIYRAKEVTNPRPESEAKIGEHISVHALLLILRTNDFVSLETALSVSSGPNSGLSARLPNENEKGRILRTTA